MILMCVNFPYQNKRIAGKKKAKERQPVHQCLCFVLLCDFMFMKVDYSGIKTRVVLINR